MRIAMIIADLSVSSGGPANAAFAYARALSQDGHEIRLISTTYNRGSGDEYTPSIDLDYPNLQIELTPAGSLSKYIHPHSLAFARSIQRATAWADVVHINSLYLPQNVYALAASKIYRKPYVIRPHGTLEPYQRQHSKLRKRIFDGLIGRRYLKNASGFHFTAASEASNAADRLGKAREIISPVPVIPPERIAEPGNSKEIIFLGRITPKKQLGILLEAFSRARQKFPEWTLTVAGPCDPEQAHVVTTARSMPGVNVIGLVQGTEKLDLLQRAAVFVLPSLNENYGVAVVEAMAAGLPVITTRDVATHELVMRADAGCVIDNPNPTTLAATLAYVMSDSTFRSQAGARGRRLVEQDLGPQEIGSSLAEELRAVIPNRTQH